jgi:hypothetical protein
LCQHGGVSEPRSRAQRKADALAILAERHADVWVASASKEGVAHLVPLSFAWNGTHVVLATEVTSPTMRNILCAKRARLGFGRSRDVVMIDATVDDAFPTVDAPPSVTDGYAAQSDWDPRAAVGDFAYVLLRPQRVQVWREADELAGRTVMRGGAWDI